MIHKQCTVYNRGIVRVKNTVAAILSPEQKETNKANSNKQLAHQNQKHLKLRAKQTFRIPKINPIKDGIISIKTLKTNKKTFN